MRVRQLIHTLAYVGRRNYFGTTTRYTGLSVYSPRIWQDSILRERLLNYSISERGLKTFSRAWVGQVGTYGDASRYVADETSEEVSEEGKGLSLVWSIHKVTECKLFTNWHCILPSDVLLSFICVVEFVMSPCISPELFINSLLSFINFRTG